MRSLQSTRFGSIAAVGALLVSLLTFGAVASTSGVASAVVPGGQRDFTLRYTNNVNGQIVMAGNTLMRCPTDTADGSINRSCERTNAGTLAGNNNAYDMQWVDVDGDPSTFDSSSADLSLPGRVLFAGLYWTGVQKKGLVITGANGYAGVPLAAPDESAIGTVKLRAPGSLSYRSVDASQIDTGPIANSSGYTAFADITPVVAGAGSGTYTVADVQTGTGGNMGAGWTIVVAYADPSEPLRNLSVFDGLKVVSSSKPLSITLSGFKTPTAGTVRTTVGVVAAEGDAGATGDYLTVNDNLLTDAVHPSNNTENSTIASRGALVTTKNPNVPNQLGYDSSTFVADGFLNNGDTSATFAAKTSNDVYAPQAVTFATELFSPDVTLTKSVTPISGGAAGPLITPSGVLRYTVTATNDGTQNAQAVHLVDPIPANTTLIGSPTIVSGSGSVGCAPSPCASTAESVIGSLGVLVPGASVVVQSDVEVAGNVAAGVTIENSAELDFVSPDLGLPVSKYASASIVVGYPDPAVSKSLVSSTGNQFTYQVLVENTGAVATSGSIEVTDTLGATGSLVSFSGTGWNCVGSVCDRSDALAPGAVHPPLVVVATFANGADALNAAELTGTNKGGQPSDPDSPANNNDIAYASGGSAPVSYLDIQKSFLDSTVSVGASTTFAIEVRNAGPSTSTANVIVDQVPAGLRVVDTAVITNGHQGSCAVSGQMLTCTVDELPVDEVAIVAANVVADISIADTTVTNTASVESATTTGPAASSADLVVRPVADLRLTKVADVTEADPGSGVNYTVTSTNDGPNAADALTIVDHLPVAIDDSTIVATPDGAGTCVVDGAAVSCTWPGSTAPGASHTVQIAAQFDSVVVVADRHAVNVAETASATDELDPSSNIDSALVKIRPYADVEATVLVPGAIQPGGELTVSFVMTNNGPSNASEGRMIIPLSLEVVSLPANCSSTVLPGAIQCDVGDLSPGESVRVDLTYRDSGGLAPGTVVEFGLGVLSDESDPIDPILTNNTDAGFVVVGVPPVIDGIGPDNGTTDGGTEVEIDGEDFSPESQVEIGGTPCTGVTFISSSALTCTTGPHDPGDVDVVVINPDGLRSTLPGGFTYEGGYVPPAFTG